jgi:dTDP-4-amino-4,6-dideoxygalactose transaminase
MTDIQAAVGREQLKRLPEIITRRREIAQRYRELLVAIPGLGLPTEPAYARSNWQSFCVRLPDHCDQKGVMQEMLDRGVATRRGIMCSHREPAYRGHILRHPLPRSEEAQDRSVMLPLYPQMSDEDVSSVSRFLREACASASNKAPGQ